MSLRLGGLRSHGAVASYLGVLERNPDAQRFWTRQGYQVFRMVKPLWPRWTSTGPGNRNQEPGIVE